MAKELDIVFQHKECTYTKLDKSETAYIYSKVFNDNKELVYYEVFEIKETEILEDFENKIGSGVFKHRFPRDNDFGVWAWCFTDFNMAVDKFNAL